MLLGAIIKIACVVAVMLLMVAYMILLERKVAGWIQDRIGPNRAGPRGIIQPFCDGLKLLFKEDYTPEHVDKPLFIFAPALMMMLAVAAIAIIPFGGVWEIGDLAIDMQIARLDIGILYILALGSLTVYGVVLGGWASNNKYSLFGGMRAAAQMLSYEVPLALALLSMILMNGSLKLDEIIAPQAAGWWNVLSQPLTFLVFLVCIFAECNRLPFDLPECEQELVAGYHTEYASMKFGCYFLGEYAHIIVASSLAVVLFFGGWHPPFFALESTGFWATMIRIGIFLTKVWLFIFFYMWVRWTLPRFRFDQIMKLCWKSLVPLALALLIVNSLILYAAPENVWTFRIVQLLGNAVVFVGLLFAASRIKKPSGAGNEKLIIEPQ